MRAVLRVACILAVVSWIGSKPAWSDECDYALGAAQGSLERSNQRLNALRSKGRFLAEGFKAEREQYQAEFAQLAESAKQGSTSREAGQLAMFTMLLDEVDDRQKTIFGLAGLFDELDAAWKDRQAMLAVIIKACVSR